MNRIASSLPGRLRLKLSDAGKLPALGASFRNLDGVGELTARPAAASLIVNYDPQRLPRASIEAFARRQLGLDAPASNDEDIPDPDDTVLEQVLRAQPAPRRKWRLVANRYAKYGAVAAMAVSLLAIAARRKRLHTQAGLVSLALTALHMTIHRRNLLR